MKNLSKDFMNLAPIVLFVYNRAECTLKTLKHLKQNVLADQSELFIYSDGPKSIAKEDDIIKINKVREIIRKDKWCRKVNIIESPVNLGLADSTIKGVTETVNRFGKVIVLEDDLLTSVHYLEFMNKGLIQFEKSEKVFQIVGYTGPFKTNFRNEAFFLPIVSSLGWGTWARSWKYFKKYPADYHLIESDKKLRKRFDLNNSYPFSEMLIGQMETGLDSWGVRWWWAVFKQQGISLFPDRTLIAHIGFDSDATHTKNVIPEFNKYWLPDYSILNFPKKIEVNESFYRRHCKYLRSRQGTSLQRKIKNRISKWLSRIYNKILES